MGLKYSVVIVLLVFCVNANAEIVNGTFVCIDDLVDCNANGVCLTDGTGCHCDDGYVTHDSNDGTECNYEQKKQIIAVPLDFFLGYFGAGRFYVGDYVVATVKLLLPVIEIVLVCGCGIGATSAETQNGAACGICGMYTVSVVIGLVVGLWYVIDVILFLANAVHDGNGIELESW